MMSGKTPKTLIIYGPTATGKTNLAISLAKKFNGELISADSRQVYRGLDIGTGKVKFGAKVEKYRGYWIVDGVKIHGFDLVDPSKQFTVADFLKYANSSMIQIIELNKLPIIVGGTGFYIKALTDGIDSIGIPADQKLRKKLEKMSADELYQKLESIDPQRASLMNQSDRANPRRLIRAIEIATMSRTNHSHSGVATTTIESRSYRSVPLRSRMTGRVLLIGLTAPNDFLYQKAKNWIQERLKKGMTSEVQGLINRGVDQNWLDNLGLEYRWLSRSVVGKIGYDIAIERLIGDYHSFIRHQKTWFKKFPDIKLFDISKPNWRQKIEKMLSLES